MITVTETKDTASFTLGSRTFTLSGLDRLAAESTKELIEKIEAENFDYTLDSSKDYNFLRFYELGVTVSFGFNKLRAEYYSGERYVDKDYTLPELIKFLKGRRTRMK